ncbi:MAG: glycosyltransferase [Acidobacteriota bacterium]
MEGLFCTIAICTRNRAAMLPGAIRSAIEQRPAPEAFEVLVVDNGSTDTTALVLAEQVRRYLALRVVIEPRVGLSAARNRALQEARGDAVVFVDDDGRLCPGYVETLYHYWKAERPACLGGPIELAYLDKPPSWWRPEHEFLRGRVDYGDRPCSLHFPAYPFGCNIAFSRATALELGGFNERLGSGARGPQAGEETELCARLERRGRTILYHPGLRVVHEVTLAGIRRARILATVFSSGRSFFWVARAYHGDQASAKLLKRMLWYSMAGLRHQRLTDATRFFYAAGATYEAWRSLRRT